MTTLHLEKIEAFGVKFHRITFEEITRQICLKIESRERLLIGYTNLHGAFLAQQDKEFETFAEHAHIYYADGMPLVIWRGLLWKDVGRKHRSTLSQTLPQLLSALSSKGFRVYYVGSEPTVLNSGIEALRALYPSLHIEGHHGFFAKQKYSNENLLVLEKIKDYNADLLLVGMGMPLQEKWIMENIDKINVPVIYAAGAAIEYFSGHVPKPSAWISNNGMEWLFRLWSQPHKLWRRYLVEPWALLVPAFGDIRNRIKSRN